jgi:glutamate-1-semialdehyde 2,1-aminomutase
LKELANNDGEALVRANATGQELMEGLRAAARKHGIPVAVTGFGAAFALHFTDGPEPRDYRETLRDDRQRLDRFLLAALGEGLNLLPDGRFYVSAAHTSRDVEETLDAFDRAFATLA